jgi:hypothetical protein
MWVWAQFFGGQDRFKWQALVDVAMNFWYTKRKGEYNCLTCNSFENSGQWIVSSRHLLLWINSREAEYNSKCLESLHDTGEERLVKIWVTLFRILYTVMSIEENSPLHALG